MNYSNVLITGLFGLLVAIVTWALTSKRDKWKFKKERLIQRYLEQEALYTQLLSSFDKIIRVTKTGGDHSALADEISIIGAKVNLIGDAHINQKLQVVSGKMQDWIDMYVKGRPKKLGDTLLSLLSNENFDYMKKADLLYPEMMAGITQLNIEMRKYLIGLRKEIDKL